MRGLIDGGGDLLLLETIFDTLNAKAGIVAIEEVFEEKGVRLPVMISVTVTDRSGRTLSGQTIDAFWVSIAHAQPFSVGINCALGAREMRPYLAELARIADCYVSCYPNAGLPNAFGAVRRAARRDRRAAARVRRQRLREHRRRLLRHDAGSHPRDRGGGRRPAAAADVGSSDRRLGAALHAVLRPRDADDPARQQLPDDRRADQRHRLARVRAADQGRRLRRRRRRSRSSRCAAARTSSTSTWTRACSTPSRR